MNHSATCSEAARTLSPNSDQKRSIQVAVGIILNASELTATTEVLLARRQAHQAHSGLWEFPGGKVESGEACEAALVRELQEEIGITATTWSYFERVDLRLEQTQLSLMFYWVTDFEGKVRGVEGQQVQWWPVVEALTLAFPPANDPILKKMAALLIRD